MGQVTPAAAPAQAATAAARKMDEAETYSRPATTQSYQRAVPSMAQPRGARVGDTFIPPRPVDPRVPSGDLFGAQDEVLTAPSKQQAPAVKATARKSPSLFERFTLQREKEKPAAAPVRAEASIEAHDGGKQEEDELDIPAFLRRQAN
jgi:hypothetical protein